MSMPVAMSVPAAVPASGSVSQTSNGTESTGEGDSFAGVLESVTERDANASQSTGEEATSEPSSEDGQAVEGDAGKQPEAAAAAVIEVAVVAARVVVTQATAEPTLSVAPTGSVSTIDAATGTTTIPAPGAAATTGAATAATPIAVTAQGTVTTQGVAEIDAAAVATTAQAPGATPEVAVEGLAVAGVAVDGDAVAKPTQTSATTATQTPATQVPTVTTSQVATSQVATPQNATAQQAQSETGQVQGQPQSQPQQGQPAVTADPVQVATNTQGQLGSDAGTTGGEGQSKADANLAGQLAEVQIANDKTGTAVAGTDHAAKAVIDNLGNVSKPGDLSSVTAKTTPAAQPAPLPEPIKQVVSFLSPLRQYGDGDYKLLLQLHPEHLGRVEVAVSLNNGQINMSLNSDNASSRQLLKDNMPDLRAALADAGLDAGTLDVGNQSSQGRDKAAESGGNSQVSGVDADIDEEELFAHLRVSSSNSATDGPLDVRV